MSVTAPIAALRVDQAIRPMPCGRQLEPRIAMIGKKAQSQRHLRPRWPPDRNVLSS
jgi:hypothetical protein